MNAWYEEEEELIFFFYTENGVGFSKQLIGYGAAQGLLDLYRLVYNSDNYIHYLSTVSIIFEGFSYCEFMIKIKNIIHTVI